MKTPEQELVKQGSRTYYFSSKFFPKKTREDVFKLYSFVRVAGGYVGHRPLQSKKLSALEKGYIEGVGNHAFDATAHAWDDTDTRVIKNIVRLSHKYKFDPAWVDSFLNAMKQEVDLPRFKTLDDSLKFVHGSAEVVGLMMAKIFALPEEAYESAKVQARAMQWLRFIRDINENNQLERCYFPREDLQKYGLTTLNEAEARENPSAFQKFVRYQIKRYKKWQQEAEAGLLALPKRFRVPVQTAVHMYDWTAEEINKDPFIVFNGKVKPGAIRVVSVGLRQSVRRKPKL